MLSGAPIILPAEAAADAKAYLRIVGTDEDALVARLLRSAAELCEGFTGQALMTRTFEDFVAGSGAWERLSATPVKAILAMETVPVEGAASPLAADAYAVDVDANGDGWVRVTSRPNSARLRVRYNAGLATEWTDLPEALRQGVLRLGAHLYTCRDEAVDAGPPAAVAALWRPFRRMRLR